MTRLIKPVDFATSILCLRGKPLSFVGYEPFIEIYNSYPQTLVLKSARQLGKSVSLAGSLITNSILTPEFNSLFVTPLAQQTSRFSTAYLDPYMRSPLVQKHFISRGDRKNVLLKQFNNGSNIFLGYASDESDADRIRGINGDQVLVDEAQDVSMEALPILFECLSASDYGYRRLTGTAKTENGTLELWWNRSNKLEWVWKCQHCGKWIVPYDYETCVKILEGLNGPACPRCGKESHNVHEGKWISFNPVVKNVYGFHLPQVIFGARLKKWQDIRDKVQSYSPAKLANEVLGLASGMGGRPISMRECMNCCNEERTSFDTARPYGDNENRGINQIVIGADWSVSGGGDGKKKSYTVFAVLGFDPNGKCYLLHAEKHSGTDIIDQVTRLKNLFRQFDAQGIGSDRGVGVLQGQMLQREFGPERVFMVQYTTAKHLLRYDQQGGFFSADRTRAIDVPIMAMKQGKTKFESPAWSVMAPFYKDVLAIYEEESISGKRLIRKDEDTPDDFLHAVTFGMVAFDVLNNRYTFATDPDYPEAQY